MKDCPKLVIIFNTDKKTYFFFYISLVFYLKLCKNMLYNIFSWGKICSFEQISVNLQRNNRKGH